MRVNGILNTNFGIPKKSLNFGKFMDDNARKVVKQALTDDYDATQWCYDGYFKKIDECKYVEVYTNKDGIVKGRFNDEFIKNHANGKIKLYMQDIEEGQLDNLSITSNAEDVADCINDIDKLLKGIDPALPSSTTSKPYGDFSSYAEMRIPGNDPWEIY